MENAPCVLLESVLRYTGRMVRVRPFHGWGWSGIQPHQFNMRVWEFGRDAEGKIRGGVGQIETPEHPFNANWVAFAVRNQGQWDFERSVGNFNVAIYQSRPNPSPAFVTGGSFPRSTSGSVAAGYATIDHDA